MRLLTFNSHEAYLYDLARLGLPMDVVVGLPGHHHQSWDERMRPLPENVRPVKLADVLAAPPAYDCLIAHNLTDLFATKTLSCPRVLVLHSSLQGRIAQERSRVSAEEMAAMTRTYMEALRGVIMIVSEPKRQGWGFDCPVIPAAIDMADYGGYTGEIAGGLRVANHVTAKKQVLRWDFHEQAFSGLPMTLLGVNPDIYGARPSDGWDDLKQHYRTRRFYIHTAAPGFEEGYNMATLEAMATGMPVLASAHPTCPVEDGVSGYVSDDPAVLRQRAGELLANPVLARELGAAARRTVAERFPMERFLASWRELLESARGRFFG